jgi:fructosamine-3-kinase
LDTPRVLCVTRRLLLLEALPALQDSPEAWERFARELAAVHRGTVHDRFGWHGDGYLGRLRQVNSWTASGHDFFAEHRLLRYLRELLSTVAHFGTEAVSTIQQIRQVLAPFC